MLRPAAAARRESAPLLLRPSGEQCSYGAVRVGLSSTRIDEPYGTARQTEDSLDSALGRLNGRSTSKSLVSSRRHVALPLGYGHRPSPFRALTPSRLRRESDERCEPHRLFRRRPIARRPHLVVLRRLGSPGRPRSHPRGQSAEARPNVPGQVKETHVRAVAARSGRPGSEGNEKDIQARWPMSLRVSPAKRASAPDRQKLSPH